MDLTPKQTEKLLNTLQQTREDEINCNECLDRVAEFAEGQLKGATLSKALQAVEHHLAICVECREEYESLLAALKAMGDESP